MDQGGGSEADIWVVSTSPSTPVASVFEKAGDIEESIKLASAPASPMMTAVEASITVFSSSPPGGPILPNPSEPNFLGIIAVSPASPSSSLSELSMEPNSPISFHINGPTTTFSPIGNTTFNTVSDNPPDSLTMTTPMTRKVYSRPDPCADGDWVVSLRVAHDLDQIEGVANSPVTTTHHRNLRSRQARANTTFSNENIPSSSSLRNTAPGSKRRGRSSLGNQSNNSIPRVFPANKRKRARKNQKVDPASEPHGSHVDGGEKITVTTGEIDETTPLKKGRKREQKKIYAYVTEELEESSPDEGTRRSVPPSFTFRYAVPHTSFKLEKEPLPSYGYWSDGADDPGNLKPIGGVFQRKDGLLTDAVCITESRLRPRKSAGNHPLESPQPRKLRPTRASLTPGKELVQDLESFAQPGQTAKKRTLEERDDESEESSDEYMTATEDEYHEDDSSFLDKTDEGDEELDDNDEGEDEVEDDLELENKTNLTTNTEDNQDLGENLLKKQKLNTGKSTSSTGRKPQNKVKFITDSNLEDMDIRVWPAAISLVNGVYMIPNACDNCRASRYFCNRNLPCSRCHRRGESCHRSPGQVPARQKQDRRKKGELELEDKKIKKARNDSSIDRPDVTNSQLENELESPQSKPRGRPPKNKVKKEREINVVSAIGTSDPQDGKPPGIRQPEVWCESRQELCESLPYYRSYQSGCYGHDGLVHGYLLDGFGAPRDYVDGKVVISHSGGKSTADEDGQRRLLTNQTSEDKVIKYLLNNMKNNLPLVMIMGTQCTSSPSKIPYRYCVMDWFKVTAGWAERDPRSRYTRWKFRFEKLDTTIDGWWAAAPTVEYDTPTEMVKASCNFCKTESPHVYEEGWMCLKPECIRFWTLNGKDAPADVQYTDNFLRCRTPWPTEFLTPPCPLGPPLNFNRDVFFDGGDVSRVFWKGMCCPKCGRLNCREFWAGWRCLSCMFEFNPPRTIFDATRLADPHRPVFTGPAIPANICHDDITYERYVRDGMTVIQYQLGDCGTVTHILANQSSNARPMDADWLFHEYQSADMPFKRFVLGNHKAQGRLLTQQFTFNCGAPYKFIVDVESHSFDQSPAVVSRALEVIHDRVNLVHPEAQFNEVLNVGYFEKQKMDYHDDGEEGLGETVASISLGAPARMRFRVKSKYNNHRHCWTTEPAIPPQIRPNEHHLKEEPKNDDSLEVGDDSEDDDLQPNEVIGGQQPPSPQGRGSKTVSKGRVKLDLCLSHGDVMVMKGRDIQKYWEHSVIPQGLFRIAATARFIKENHPGVLNKAKTDAAAAAAEAAKATRKLEDREQELSSGSVLKLAGHSPLTSSGENSGDNPLSNSAPEYPFPTVANRGNQMLDLSKDSSGTMVQGLHTNHPPHTNWPKPTPPKAQSGQNGYLSTARNPFSGSALASQGSFGNSLIQQTQGLPRFATSNILHSMDQPIGWNNRLSLSESTSRFFSAIPGQVLPSRPTNLVLPSLREVFSSESRSSLGLIGDLGPAPVQMRMGTMDRYFSDSSYQQNPMHISQNDGVLAQTRPEPFDSEKLPRVGNSDPIQTMPNMLTTTGMEQRIPGLTLLPKTDHKM